MTKISTRRPDGTLFGQNSAPVGFSVDLSEPLVCVFRGASRPCARFARDENVEIFSQCRINTFLFFLFSVIWGCLKRQSIPQWRVPAESNCKLFICQSLIFSIIPNCFETSLKTFWKLSNKFQTPFQKMFQQNVQRHFQNKFKEMYKDIFNKKQFKEFFKEVQNALNCF